MATAQTTGYEVDGNVVASLKEVSELLGEKVTKKDIEEGGKFADLVGMVDLKPEATEDDTTSQETKPATKPETKKTSAPKEDHSDEEVYTALSPEDMENLANVDPDEIQSAFPEFDNLDEVKEFIKDIDTPTLEYLATGLGLEWKPTYHANIHRMRIAMEIQKHFFPEHFKPKESKKSKAKYGDFDTDALFNMVAEHELDVKRSGNDPIDRMRAIMALKKAGVLAE